MNENEGDLYELSDGVREDLRASFPTVPFPKERIERRIRRSVGDGAYAEVPTAGDMRGGVPGAATPDARGDFPGATGTDGRSVFAGAGMAPPLDAATSPRSLWERVRPVLQAAAVLAVFIGGAEYGRRLGPRGGVTESAREAMIASGIAPGATLPLEIQASGSRYIATLARFSAESQSLPLEQRQIAREVAMAVMYSAAIQLLEEGGEDAVLQSVANMVIERRALWRDSAAMLAPGS
jgi:hypothetical protein